MPSHNTVRPVLRVFKPRLISSVVFTPLLLKAHSPSRKHAFIRKRTTRKTPALNERPKSSEQCSSACSRICEGSRCIGFISFIGLDRSLRGLGLHTRLQGSSRAWGTGEGRQTFWHFGPYPGRLTHLSTTDGRCPKLGFCEGVFFISNTFDFLVMSRTGGKRRKMSVHRSCCIPGGLLNSSAELSSSPLHSHPPIPKRSYRLHQTGAGKSWTIDPMQTDRRQHLPMSNPQPPSADRTFPFRRAQKKFGVLTSLESNCKEWVLRARRNCLRCYG